MRKVFINCKKRFYAIFNNQSLVIIRRIADYYELLVFFYANFRAQHVLKQICFNFKNICTNILKNKFRIKNATIPKIQRIF